MIRNFSVNLGERKMKTRPIDANQLYRIEKLLDTDIVKKDKVASELLEQVLYDIQHVPTLTPPSEPLTAVGYFKASGDLALCRCPFCGSEDVVYERYLHTAGYRWRVVCTSCTASIDPGHAQQRSTVQRMWNTRPAPPI